ncbi:hypothetical protein [Nocardia sp. NPDC049526]|uniref:hypothetical protein n=1 Tax=Nocardia sp. NPDC049526 TaxID=3364316 RepID=UPI0037B77C42
MLARRRRGYFPGLRPFDGYGRIRPCTNVLAGVTVGAYLVVRRWRWHRRPLATARVEADLRDDLDAAGLTARIGTEPPLPDLADSDCGEKARSLDPR